MGSLRRRQNSPSPTSPANTSVTNPARSIAAVLLRLHAAPIYFHRKGRGPLPQRPRRNPPGRPRRPREENARPAAIEDARRTARRHAARRTPPAGPPAALQARPQPPRNQGPRSRLRRKRQIGCHLLLDCGAWAPSHELHFDRFLFEFPGGTGFPPRRAPPAHRLPLAAVRAFSIDDAATTEIDDAFSVTPTRWLAHRHPSPPRASASARLRPRRHRPRAPVDGTCRATRSPCCRTTSSPASPRRRPRLPGPVALPRGEPRPHRHRPSSRVERVPVAANLRHHDIEPVFSETTLAEGGPTSLEGRAHPAVGTRHRARSRPRQARRQPEPGRLQLQRRLVRQTTADGPGRIEIGRRPRLALDKLVAELMIAATAPGGQGPRRGRHPGPVPRPDRRQGAHDHRRAPHEGPRRRLLRLVQLAAAPLRGPGQPVAAHRLAAGEARPSRPVARPDRRDARLRTHLRRLRRVPARHGALLVPALAAPAKATRP